MIFRNGRGAPLQKAKTGGQAPSSVPHSKKNIQGPDPCQEPPAIIISRRLVPNARSTTISLNPGNPLLLIRTLLDDSGHLQLTDHCALPCNVPPDTPTLMPDVEASTNNLIPIPLPLPLLLLGLLAAPLVAVTMFYPSETLRWIQLKRYQYEVTFSLYMLTPTEKFIFNSFLFLFLSMILIAASLYLPEHISIISRRVLFYFAGDDTGAAAYQYAKAASGATSSAISPVIQATAKALKDAAIAGTKEL